MMYSKHKENDEFIQKKKEYDMKYYEQNKDILLSKRKINMIMTMTLKNKLN